MSGERRDDTGANLPVYDCDGFSGPTEEHDGRGIIDRAEGAGDGDVAVFQRLAHDLEHVAPEFRKFVKEQHPDTAPLDRPILVLTVSLPKRR